MGTLPERVKQTRARKIMRDIEAYMTGRAGTQEIYRNVPKQLPRRYYAVQDTSGIRSALDTLYKAVGTEAKFLTLISEPGKWPSEEEVNAFGA